MKNNHIKTAVKTLRKQITKFENDRDRWESAEKTAQANKAFFTNEIERLEKHIEALESTQPKELEAAHT